MAENYLHIYIQCCLPDFDFPKYIKYILEDEKVNPDIKNKYLVYNGDDIDIDDFFFDVERQHIFVTRHVEELNEAERWELNRLNFRYFYIDKIEDVEIIKNDIVEHIVDFSLMLTNQVKQLGDSVIIISDSDED